MRERLLLQIEQFGGYSSMRTPRRRPPNTNTARKTIATHLSARSLAVVSACWSCFMVSSRLSNTVGTSFGDLPHNGGGARFGGTEIPPACGCRALPCTARVKPPFNGPVSYERCLETTTE